jgi:hypothetical protein
LVSFDQRVVDPTARHIERAFVITALLIVHGLMAVALLGALTHQALAVASVGSSQGKRSFFGRFRTVNAAAYAPPIAFLFVVTALLGGLIYPQYRVDVRTTLEDMQLRAANGVFEIKEHFVAVGLGVLPAYVLFWRTPLAPESARSRRYLTWMLTFVVWWSFLIGHILNNIKGLLP